MQRKIAISGVAAVALISGTYAWAQGSSLPWGQSADMIGWETFVQVVSPSGNPSNPSVEFETWASDQDIYASPTGVPQWPSINAPKKLQRSFLGVAGMRHGSVVEVPSPSDCAPPQGKQAAAAAKFPDKACIGEEVRRNWATFQYIASNGLYNTAGLKAAYANNLTVDLPSDAIEVKGDWVSVKDLKQWLANNKINLTDQQIRARYYVNTAGGVQFALVAFHFSTKQQKNWVWADFEHELNPGRCDVIGCHDSYGAVVANINPKSVPDQQYGACAKSAKVRSMFVNAGISPVWNHYCMKGSQISYMRVTPGGPIPSLLGNSVIEAINADVPIKNSSCIGCHAYASFNAQGQFNPALANSPVGTPDPKKIQGAGYRSNDFIWGLVLFSPPGPTKP